MAAVVSWPVVPPLARAGGLPPEAAVAAHVEAARAAAAGQRTVALHAGAPADDAALAEVVRALRAEGYTVAVAGAPAALPPDRARALGVAIAALDLSTPLARADAEAYGRAHLRLFARVRLDAPDLADVAASARVAERVVLDGSAVGGPRRTARLAEALEVAWRALSPHLAGPPPAPVAPRGPDSPEEPEVSLAAAATPPDTSPGPPRPHDALLERLRRLGGWLPGLGGGVRGPTAAADVARLHALGTPVADAPPPRCAPIPGLGDGPLHVVIPDLHDVILTTGTLPALAEAARARGVAVTVHSVWHAPWSVGAAAWDADLGALGGDGAGGPGTGLPGDDARRVATARQLGASLLQHLDLRGATAILVPGWAAARAVWDHPSRPAGARVVVLDLHLLDGIGAWADLLPDLPPGIDVVSCFPAFAENYLHRGVPLDRVRFRPYPVPTARLPAAPPVAEAPTLLAAGNHRRAHDLLATALAGAPLRRPVVVHTADPTPLPAPLDHRGMATLPDLFRAVARARAVILPVAFDPHDAAGISLAAMALAAGRPVIGTTAWGLMDHVPHDRAGLLLAPDDPDGLREAVLAVDRDDSLATRLGAGAADAGRRADPSALWRALCAGDAAWPAR